MALRRRNQSKSQADCLTKLPIRRHKAKRGELNAQAPERNQRRRKDLEQRVEMELKDGSSDFNGELQALINGAQERQGKKS